MKKAKLIISSPEFINEGLIPLKFTCKGEGYNPALVIDGVPEGTHSMVLIMEDPDTAKGVFTHWVLFDIQPTNSISENSSQGVSGINSRGQMGYTPPCPPSGIHRYYFHVFALDRALDLHPGSSRSAVEAAMRAFIMASGSLMGRFGFVRGTGEQSETRDTNESATEGYDANRTIVDETGAGAWTSDKKVQHGTKN
jgi:Raf kinase inhibitor-like YbhB/YbcL family protein